jgi:tRNA U38,U39,U40 pseudouridine synthase TruA
MIGLLIQICHEGLDANVAFSAAFKSERFHIYLAPAEGLYLNRMTFDLYNKKKEPSLQVHLDEEDDNRIYRFR